MDNKEVLNYLVNRFMYSRSLITSKYSFESKKIDEIPKLTPLLENPLLSIVIPSFNQISYIEECIHSILNQNYPHFKILVMDGNSTDGTKEFLEDISKKDSRIKWISEDDEGPLSAIYKGLRLSKGQIIGIIPTSDYYLAGAFQSAVTAFLEDPLLCCIGGECVEISLEGEFKKDLSPTPPKTAQIEYLGINDLLNYRLPHLQSSFFRKELLNAFGGFDENLKTCHTISFLHFFLQGIKLGGKIAVVRKEWGTFRRHEGANSKFVQENVMDLMVERSLGLLQALKVYKKLLTKKQSTEFREKALIVFANHLIQNSRWPFLIRVKYKFKRLINSLSI
jgi:glycosyltransferase involved in cell wall biosynthesis